jgi:DNA processing protein
LYFKGSATLENQRFLSIVGTRNPSVYGIEWTKKFVKDLEGSGIVVVSGLAEGIDTIAHESALQNGLNSIGILGHGLHTIYPAANRKLAARMIDQGGLLTHFPSGTNPERQHFPSRNRITGGICDALVVVETGIRGGSLITADLAYGYQKEIFALPGRVTDLMSAGTNHLILQQQAIPVHNAFDFLDYVKWSDLDKTNSTHKKNSSLFFYPSANEKKLLDLILDPVHIDVLSRKMEISHAQLASILLQLELNGIVLNKPGKRYQLNPAVTLL